MQSEKVDVGIRWHSFATNRRVLDKEKRKIVCSKGHLWWMSNKLLPHSKIKKESKRKIKVVETVTKNEMNYIISRFCFEKCSSFGWFVWKWECTSWRISCRLSSRRILARIFLNVSVSVHCARESPFYVGAGVKS